MTTATIHQAKTHFSKYLEAIQSGKETEIIIKKYNTPIGKIIPYTTPETNKINAPQKDIKELWGKYKGKINIDDSFNDSLEDDFDGPLFPKQ